MTEPKKARQSAIAFLVTARCLRQAGVDTEAGYGGDVHDISLMNIKSATTDKLGEESGSERIVKFRPEIRRDIWCRAGVKNFAFFL